MAKYRLTATFQDRFPSSNLTDIPVISHLNVIVNLTSMEDVIFLSCIGTISSSWHGSSAKAFEFNGFKICLRPGRKGDFWAAFFLTGLLGKLVWHVFVRSWIPLSNKLFCYCNDCCAFSQKFFMLSLSVSSFSISLLSLNLLLRSLSPSNYLRPRPHEDDCKRKR